MFANPYKKKCQEHETGWMQLKSRSVLLMLDAIFLEIKQNPKCSQEPGFHGLQNFVNSKQTHDPDYFYTMQNASDILDELVKFREKVGQVKMNRLFPITETCFRFVTLLGGAGCEPHTIGFISDLIDRDHGQEYNHSERSILRFLLALVRSGGNARLYDPLERLNLRFDTLPEGRG